jgi:segregation and condensation protein B
LNILAAMATTTVQEPDPRSVLEALLFVGNQENVPLSPQEAAASVGGLTPRGIQEIIETLNAQYTQEGAAYTIVHEPAGFRLTLREEFERVRHRFYSRIREARLSRGAIEVLAIVAYRQPIRTEDVDALRGGKSGAILAQLVRRRLLTIERPEDAPRRPLYRTTDRFLSLYGLAGLEDLPCIEEFASGDKHQRSDSDSAANP